MTRTRRPELFNVFWCQSIKKFVNISIYLPVMHNSHFARFGFQLLLKTAQGALKKKTTAVFRQ